MTSRTTTNEAPAQGASLSPMIRAAIDCLNDPCWQLRDAPTIAGAILGETGVDPLGLLAMIEDDNLRAAVAEAMDTAQPDPEGVHALIREADAARARREGTDEHSDDMTLPPPHRWGEWMQDPPKIAPPLIEGVLRLGATMFVTAPSKAGKSWLADDLAVSVASGTPWLGMPCRRGRVLLIDFELDPGDLYRRLSQVMDRRSHLLDAPDYAELCRDNLDVWCLREHPVTTEELCRNVTAYAAKAAREAGETPFGYFALVIVDPLYSLVAGDGADENSASEMGRTLAQLRACTSSLGASCVLPHHHPKGASGSRDALDRGAGSGVIGRFGDAILDLSRLFLDERHQAKLNEQHKADLDANDGDDLDAYRLTFAGVRSFKAPRPLDLIWTWPCYTVAEAADRLAECGIVGSDPIAEQNARRRAESGDRHAAINEAVGAALDRLEASGATATKEATFEESHIEGMTPSQFGKLFEARNAWFEYRTERVSGSRQSRVVRKA